MEGMNKLYNNLDTPKNDYIVLFKTIKMNITVKSTPSTIAARMFGKEHAKPLCELLKKRSIEDIYEIIGMAHADFDETVNFYTEATPENIFCARCFKEQIEGERITREALDYQPAIEEGIYQCNKCNGKRTLREMSQDRSGDEGMTTYIICMGCFTRWKEN